MLRLLLLLLVGGMSGVVAYLVWSRLGPERPSTIVLVTLDTLRADHLGCYGYPRATSPFIDSLAEAGALFTRAFAPISTTAPSHASLFTGLYPSQHGVKKNGQRLDRRFLTLAELLQAEHYFTAGFVSTDVHFRKGAMNQGFAVFDEPRLPRGDSYRPGTVTVRRATEWLETHNSDDPLFLWVHLFDPHTPHDPDHEFPAEAEPDRKELRRFLVEEQSIDFSYFGNDEERLFQWIDGYDGEIRATDEAVRELFEAVTRLRPEGEAMWIITADHGEGLGNHRWLGHGKPIYNEQIRIPLLIYFSSGWFRGRTIDQVVENVDLPATVAQLIGAEFIQPGSHGESLLGVLHGWGAQRAKRYAFAERREFDHTRRPKRIVWELTGYEDGDRQSLQDAAYKYIRWTAGEDQFFDLRNDPYETENLAGTGLPEEARLRNDLLSLVSSLQRPGEAAPSVDAETLERLEALGYDP